MVNKDKKGIYQVRRLTIDVREEKVNGTLVESTLNEELLRLSLEDNIEIVDVVEMLHNITKVIILIKYYDYGLN